MAGSLGTGLACAVAINSPCLTSYLHTARGQWVVEWASRRRRRYGLGHGYGMEVYLRGEEVQVVGLLIAGSTATRSYLSRSRVSFTPS